MSSAENTVKSYEELAGWYERQGLDQLRDRFLVLAADAALSAGHADQAERLRARLLEHNPHHLLKPYATLAEALKTPDVQNYVSGLRRGYPPESIGPLLEGLRSGKPVPHTAGKPKAAPTPRPRPPEPELTDDDVGTLRFSQEADELPPMPPPARPTPKPAEPAIYPVKEEAASPKPAAPRSKPAATPHPAPVLSAPQPVVKAPAKHAPGRPSPPPPKPLRSAANPGPALEPSTPYALASDPGGARGRSRERDDAEAYPGGWVPSVLFVLLLLAGLALAGYTLLGPFLPAEWVQ